MQPVGFLDRLKACAGNTPLSNWLNEAGVRGGTRGSLMSGNTPSVPTLMKICKAHRLDAHWLLTGESPLRANAPRAITPRRTAQVLEMQTPAGTQVELDSMRVKMTTDVRIRIVLP